jgi:hypothetical protein
MPTRFLEDSTPVIHFDPQLEVSPFAVFRRLREGHPPLLIDMRPHPAGLTLRSALPYPDPQWAPPSDQDVVLFDGDGSVAIDGARRMQAAGYPRVRALFGGLELWDFSLDPEVVGEDIYLDKL